MKRFASPRLTKVRYNDDVIGTLIETEGQFESFYDSSLLMAGVFAEGRLISVLRYSRAKGGKKTFRGFANISKEILANQDLQICWLDYKGRSFMCRWPLRNPFEVSKPKLKRKVVASGFIDHVHVAPDHMTVEGWALIDGEVPEKIELKIDDEPLRVEPILRNRPDLSKFLRDPRGQQYAGFYFMRAHGAEAGAKTPKVEIVAHYKGKSLKLKPRESITRAQI